MLYGVEACKHPNQAVLRIGQVAIVSERGVGGLVLLDGGRGLRRRGRLDRKCMRLQTGRGIGKMNARREAEGLLCMHTLTSSRLVEVGKLFSR